MPSTARLDSIRVTTDLLEAILPTPEELAAMPVKTPYPLLRKTGNRGELELRTAVLENDWLQVTFCLDLGGRMLGLLDKRTETWILEIPRELHLEEGGVRGVRLDLGLELIVGQGERLNALGPVEHMLIEPSEDDESAAVILHELIPGLGVSWHARWSLPNDAAKLELEFRALNRDLYSFAEFEVGLACATMPVLAGPSSTELSLYDGRDKGLALSCERPVFDLAVHESGRFVRKSKLYPRHTDDFKAELIPYSGFPQPGTPVAGGVGTIIAETAHFQACEEFDSLEIMVMGREVLEVPAQISADCDLKRPQSFPIEPLSEFTPVGRGSLAGCLYDLSDALTTENLLDEVEQRDEEWRRSGSYRGASRIQDVLLHDAADDYDLVIAKCEEALLWIGDDHLTWWQIAALQRNRDGVEEERPALLNAHFLAPMEPLLRAEAFLAMPILQSKDPSPILSPLAANPEAALDAVLLYFNAGLHQDMVRLADELLRHRDHAQIRYALAFQFQMKRLLVEAAMHIQKAESLPLEGPLPWHRELRSILGVLGNKYPDFPKLKQMFQYISCWYP